MRVFVYEHITGGGMLDDAQIGALAAEGELMLRALLDDLNAVPGVEVSVMRDFRLNADVPATVRVVRPGRFEEVLDAALAACDAAWPIAPETGGALLRITRKIEASGRRLLGARSRAVAVAASKRATAAVLARAGIAAAPVYASPEEIPPAYDALVAKPDDGAGCQDTWLLAQRRGSDAWPRANAHANMVFQPYIRGEARSLSILCCDAGARLLCCNRQNVGVLDGALRFGGVVVNALTEDSDRHAALASAVCAALPGLWGYCGVDFISSSAGPVVIEVNPRLTTAYAGLRRALGVNAAQLVLDLPASLGASAPRQSRAIDLRIAHAP